MGSPSAGVVLCFSHTMATLRPGGPKLVFLVGFMGAGKTSVARALGQKLGWSFEDLDDRIEAREGQPIHRIFETSGESGFRQAETAALRELLAETRPQPYVVALGGGAFAQAQNVDMIEQAAVPVIFLDGPPEELFQRCEAEQGKRPLQSDLDRFRDLYQQRRPAYLRAAHRVDTAGKDVDEVAMEVASCLGLL